MQVYPAGADRLVLEIALKVIRQSSDGTVTLRRGFLQSFSNNRLLTREGGSPLTPQYAAPEQLSNQPVTTATGLNPSSCVLPLPSADVYGDLEGIACRFVSTLS